MKRRSRLRSQPYGRTDRPNPYARPDARTRAAKAQGYPARSVFKLQEIDRRFGLLRPGYRVLDLGAAPGSWTLYAAERVGVSGLVVAVDLTPIEQDLGDRVVFVQRDVLEEDVTPLASHGPFDVVLSDMAPRTSGTKSADQARSFELFMAALAVASELGRAGSNFVGKLFMSDDFGRAKQAVTERYARYHGVRPEATRARSAEIFLVGLGKKGAGVRG